VQRTHPNPVPEGTWPAAILVGGHVFDQRLRSGGCEPVIFTGRPELVEDDRQLTGECDLRLCQAPALGQANCPGFQGAPFFAVMEEHVGRLVQRTANGGISGTANPA